MDRIFGDFFSVRDVQLMSGISTKTVISECPLVGKSGA